MSAQSEYTAKQITVLEGLEPVRRRPGMYIGGTGVEGLHHLIWEVCDNCLDEAMAGYADTMIVELLPDNKVVVYDNGRGIPVDVHAQTKKSALETVLTTLHAGGKFGEGGYKVSGGLHGVGVSVVNALSSWMRAEVYRDGKTYAQEYVRGKPKANVKMVGETTKKGTSISFIPDSEIFSTIDFSLNTILAHLRQQAYLTKKVKIAICDRRKNETGSCYNFYFEGGVASYVKHLNKNKEALNDPPIYIEKNAGDVVVEVGIAYTDDYNEHVFTFANNIYTTEGGTHLTGFRTALTRALNDYAKKMELVKGADLFSGDDTREGLTAVISVKLPDPQFEGQTKAKLGNPEIKNIVEQTVLEGLGYFLEEHPAEAKKIIEKCALSLRARVAAKAARDTVIRKGALEGMTLPGKLADCSSKDAANSELYIVEGDSAGGCWDGNTNIALADGRNLSFKELVEEDKQGKQNFCYTIQNNGHIGIAPILNPRITKRNAEVIKITLDNGAELVCTPDHLFMLRDGSYLPASYLTPEISIMPFQKEKITSDKQAIIKDYEFAGLSFAKRIYEKTGDINLYNRERLALPKRNPNLVKLETLINRFFNGDKKRFTEAVENFNHKIKAIEKIKEKIDVYDIEVPNTHNFALASGVFVHNSAKQGRDRKFQAILPLRGKILNVERARLDRMLSSEEIKQLIIAMGTSIGETLNMEKMRYGRIIIMTDADVDGSHIRTLLLTLFYRHFQDIIKKGHLFIAQPPLYLVQKGKTKEFAYNDEQKDAIIKKIGKDGVVIQRYKGLGEMNPTQLWDTTMNPENRILLKVAIEDAERADEIFSMLMGDEVGPRKRFIQTHAKNVKNLDV